MATSFVYVFLPAGACTPFQDRIQKLTQLPSFAAYGVPLADLITGQCTSLGQRSLGEKALRVLGFFHDKAMLKATQRKLGDTAPHDPLMLTAKVNVATVLTLKADPSKSWTCGYDGIISTRLLDHVLKCEKIKDDEKVAL